MSRRTNHARIRCGWCGKPGAVLSIAVRGKDLSGVTATMTAHDDYEHKLSTGEKRPCPGKGKAIENRDIPPTGAWY